MKNENDRTEKADIRDRLHGWAKTVRGKDIDGLMSHYAPDILLFDLAPPLQYRGAETCKKTGRSGFRHFEDQSVMISAN